jgi:cation diffusion facilitator family transporter
MVLSDAQKEKRTVAFTSVLAAIGLTVLKLIVGLLTNSLGILAEAAHSGLDLVAALMTYFAVRLSDKPADESHPYGHGKVENLSALFETLLLLITSAWIIYEAVDRLFYHPTEVDASVWGFVIMAISIIVDVNRSKMLYKAAEKYNSQALEADALHFKTDIWSSAVVILGLFGVMLAQNLPGLDWMRQTDSIAALVVALIVIFVSGELGWRTISALLDTAPKGQVEKIQQIAASINGIVDTHAVRIRPSGAHWFVDLHVKVDPAMNASQAHALASEVEYQIRANIPNVSDAMVHVEPALYEESSNWERIAYGLRQIADGMGLGLHDLQIHVDAHGEYIIDMDLEISGDKTLHEAHQLAEDFEERSRLYWPKAIRINTHLEPISQNLIYPDEVHDHTLEKRIFEFLKNFSDVRSEINIQIHKENSHHHVNIKLCMSPEISLTQAHKKAEEIKRQLYTEIPEINRIVIHVEPSDLDDTVVDQ